MLVGSGREDAVKEGYADVRYAPKPDIETGYDLLGKRTSRDVIWKAAIALAADFGWLLESASKFYNLIENTVSYKRAAE